MHERNGGRHVEVARPSGRAPGETSIDSPDLSSYVHETFRPHLHHGMGNNGSGRQIAGWRRRFSNLGVAFSCASPPFLLGETSLVSSRSSGIAKRVGDRDVA